MTEFRVIHHEAICPQCQSGNVITGEVDTGDGLTETAYQCRDCGEAWPLACISDLGVRS